jgi:cold-inducible RNA-binding protein
VAKKLYVGNLSYGMTDSDLHNLFGPHGTVQSAQVIMDRDTGRSKGFGFVEMDSGVSAVRTAAAVGKTPAAACQAVAVSPRSPGLSAATGGTVAPASFAVLVLFSSRATAPPTPSPAAPPPQCELDFGNPTDLMADVRRRLPAGTEEHLHEIPPALS